MKDLQEFFKDPQGKPDDSQRKNNDGDEAPGDAKTDVEEDSAAGPGKKQLADKAYQLLRHEESAASKAKELEAKAKSAMKKAAKTLKDAEKMHKKHQESKALKKLLEEGTQLEGVTKALEHAQALLDSAHSDANALNDVSTRLGEQGLPPVGPEIPMSALQRLERHMKELQEKRDSIRHRSEKLKHML